MARHQMKTRLKDLKNKIYKYKAFPIGMNGAAIYRHNDVSWSTFFLIISVCFLIPLLIKFVWYQLELVSKHKMNEKKISILTGFISSLVIGIVVVLLFLFKAYIYAIVYGIIFVAMFIYSVYCYIIFFKNTRK